MRILKFRAWNGKGMEYGGFTIHATGGVVGSTLSDVPDGCNDVMQFTGVKDAYGRDIYEGDVLGDKFIYEFKVVWSEKESRFGIIEKGSSALLTFNPEIISKKFKVIGNIYKNS